MKKNVISLSLSILLSVVLVTGCQKKNQEPKDYEIRQVNIYREKDQVDKQIPIHFYKNVPHVPYISVSKYYQEFFSTSLTRTKNETYYKYTSNRGNFLGFDIKDNTFSAYELYAFNYNPNFKTSESKTFVNRETYVTTNDRKARKVSLDNYSISIYEDNGEIYAPLTFLANLGGGFQGYNIAYNGQDIYVIDRNALLNDESHDENYYGESYYSSINDLSTSRYPDLAEYNYHELCFAFDVLRGKTSQLVFGDDKLLSLGLNGLLEQCYPKIKQYLLSNDKEKYYIGLASLFSGLSDGGHTSILTSSTTYQECRNKAFNDNDLKELNNTAKAKLDYKINIYSSFAQEKTKTFINKYSKNNPNYYAFDEVSKTAYIGFDSFEVDFAGWTSYYTNGGNIPSDTYSFVRNGLYSAKEDQAENVIVDITSNGGGNSLALLGIVGLLNNANARMDNVNTFNEYHTIERYRVDINLDGVFDEKDEEECQNFNFNIGIMTSPFSFSCGNLLPSILKEAGLKIIGTKSGGGSCAITFESTADGLSYVRSSYLCLSDSKGNHIDNGIPVDFEIEIKTKEDGSLDCSQYFDFTTASSYLSTAYN